MLGARARAAEYHAFKAANARQASREAEEQKLPPTPAPVSLSAFTKNPQLNRNKGNKAWIPLVLEDTPEDTLEDDSIDADLEETRVIPTTPLRQTDNADFSGPILQTQGTPLGPRDHQALRTNLPNFAIPAAPRAMMVACDRSSAILNPTPPRLQQHPILGRSQRDTVTVQSSPNNMLGMTGQNSMHTAIPIQRNPLVMIPSDISPTKQEHKFESLAREHADLSTSLPAPLPHPSSENSSMVCSSILYSHSATQYTNVPALWNQTRYTGPFAPDDADRLIVSHAESDGFVASVLPVPPSIIRHHFTYSDSDGAVVEQLTSNSEMMSENLQDDQRRPVTTPVNEPYDRNTKMQSFVAEQQALARTGKTVLRNPDLQRLRESEGASPSSAAGSTMASEQDPYGFGNGESQISNPQLAVEPPPGFEAFAGQGRILRDFELENILSPEDEILQQEFDVGMEEWFELKAIGKNERAKMTKVMRSIANTDNPVPPKTGPLRIPTDRQESIRKWLEADSQDNQAARALVNQIAREHRNNRLSNLSAGDKVYNDLVASAEIECAAICAVGNIWANLTSYSSPELLSSHGADERSVWAYKPAPEYAVERSRLVTGVASNSSFFEEETDGFYNAPSRIARDPRFRPASKDILKPKPEEEWKHRHELYGRRRL
ncbi:hypothetical protein PV08_04561 [Exophiala spinifera]|uniref:Uncharacterized protein n=1 Tax=Exophiala spinifera TaxID=91928 RepID=A0A0D1ZXG1_9EURO|nr:uncharacterized protein PV08_04561 [Exophiala spinifera]KIW17367.1 hypothetical protein PV08_04561 [Exophiala spinifera]